jgi:hypothetical protein
MWSLHLFLGRSVFLRPFGLYCSACFGILHVYLCLSSVRVVATFPGTVLFTIFCAYSIYLITIFYIFHYCILYILFFPISSFVLWVAYATRSTLKPVPPLSR